MVIVLLVLSVAWNWFISQAVGKYMYLKWSSSVLFIIQEASILFYKLLHSDTPWFLKLRVNRMFAQLILLKTKIIQGPVTPLRNYENV